MKDLKTFLGYRTNRALDEGPVFELEARSLDEAVKAMKAEQKKGGVSTMWTIYERNVDWMSIRGIVMTVVTAKGTTLQHFME